MRYKFYVTERHKSLQGVFIRAMHGPLVSGFGDFHGFDGPVPATKSYLILIRFYLRSY